MARKQLVDGGSVTEIEARFLPSSFSLVSDTFYCFLFPKVFGFGEKLEKKMMVMVAMAKLTHLWRDDENLRRVAS